MDGLNNMDGLDHDRLQREPGVVTSSDLGTGKGAWARGAGAAGSVRGTVSAQAATGEGVSKNTGGAASPTAYRLNWSDFAVMIVATALEYMIVLSGAIWHLQIGWLVLLHLTVIALLAGWVYRAAHARRDVSGCFLTLLATLATGPLGATGGLLSMMFAVVGDKDDGTRDLLEEWYERISHSTNVDEITQFCDMVAIGRAIDLAGPAPQPFVQIMQDGSLLEKQNALGLIARKFHPDYLPALQGALKSHQPVIRVQAAAVAAHVRDQMKDMLHDMLRRLPALRGNLEKALVVAAQIEQCLTSGLLEDRDRLRGQAELRALYDHVLSRTEHYAPGIDGVVSGAEPCNGQESATKKISDAGLALPMDVYESLLLKGNDFHRLRELRQVRTQSLKARREKAHYGQRFKRIRPLPSALSNTEEAGA